MKADVTSFKNNATVHHGRKCLPTILYILVPELNMTSPFFLPSWIEIYKKVDTAVKLTALHVVEIDVHIKPPAWPSNVDAASDEFLVGEQVSDACHVRETRKKCRRGKFLVELRNRPREELRVGDLNFLSFVDRFKGPALACRLVE